MHANGLFVLCGNKNRTHETAFTIKPRESPRGLLKSFVHFFNIATGFPVAILKGAYLSTLCVEVIPFSVMRSKYIPAGRFSTEIFT